MPLMHSESLDDCQLCSDVLQHIAAHHRKNQNEELVRIIELNKRWCLEHIDILS